MKTEQILVFRTGSLGDLVCTIPAFRAIRARHPGQPLCLLADSQSAITREVHHWLLRWKIVDRIVIYQAAQSLRSYWELFRVIRAERGSEAYLLSQQPEGKARVTLKKLFFHGCGLRRVFGGAWNRDRETVQPKEPDRLFHLVAGPDSTRPSNDYAVPVESDVRQQVFARLAESVDVGLPYMLFCCGGKAPTQRWPLERYLAVLQALYAKFSIPIVALGLPEEVRAVEQWIDEGLLKGVVLSGVSLPAMLEVARSALCYFGNDTGPVHVAAAGGCPAAVLLSARADPGAWDPDVTPNRIFQRRPSCHSCFLNECHVQQHRCMRDIGVDEVVQGMESFLHELLARRVERGARPSQ